MDGQVRFGVTGSEAPAHEDGAGPSERPGVCEGDSAQVGLCQDEGAAAEGNTCEGPRVRLDLIAYRFLEVAHEAMNRTEEVDRSVDRRLAARAGRRHMVLSAWEAVSAATIRDGANLAGVPQALVSQVKPRGPVPRDEQSPPPREVLSAVDAESGHDRGVPGHKRRRKRHALEAMRHTGTCAAELVHALLRMQSSLPRSSEASPDGPGEEYHRLPAICRDWVQAQLGEQQIAPEDAKEARALASVADAVLRGRAAVAAVVAMRRLL